jgi:hypothetical protein
VSTEHVLVYVPFTKHLLVPLEYTHCSTGHLPHYVNSFHLPPSYYHPFLLSPQIVYLDLTPYASQALGAIRLAYDRTDVTVTSGARLAAKRYLHVTGFEIGQPETAGSVDGGSGLGNGATDRGWQGMVSLETEGTAEAKVELERRLGVGRETERNGQELLAPWEVVREKSMMGTVWLRLVREDQVQG